MIRIAAVGDVHAGDDSRGMLRPHLDQLADHADLLLLAGDLTKRGRPAEARVVVDELGGLGVPTVAVLGNHDYECDRAEEVAAILEAGGVRVLEGSSAMLEIEGLVVGVAGTKGFGGGFAGACCTAFGEPETKAFIGHTEALAAGLESALHAIERADVRVALLHYSPVADTSMGERLEIHPFLGSYLLAEAVDRAGADLVVHGHAHAGSEKGVTPGGVPVRNVAQPVLRRAYALLCLDGRRRAVGSGAPPPRPPWGATGAHGHLPTPVGRHTRPHASW